MALSSRLFGLAMLLPVAVAIGCRLTDIPIWEAVERATEGDYEVETIHEVRYCDGPRTHCHRHALDLYLPKGCKDFPVVFLVHGGAWICGDNRCCGLYASVGEFLARHGVGAVLPNYRLAPGVKHPEHIMDVARAFAWTRRHIGAYGGNPEQIILAGHSAGGHLVALLATDESYLNAEGLSTADIKGVIAVSGVYHIPPGAMGFRLGGASPDAFRFNQIAPMRSSGPPERERWFHFNGIPMSLDPYWPAFGSDAETRAEASPVNHVRPGLPPFLILHAENDLPTLPAMAREFHAALLKCGVDSTLIEVAGRNHSSICFRAIGAKDAVGEAMLDFVRRHAVRCRASGLNFE